MGDRCVLGFVSAPRFLRGQFCVFAGCRDRCGRTLSQLHVPVRWGCSLSNWAWTLTRIFFYSSIFSFHLLLLVCFFLFQVCSWSAVLSICYLILILVTCQRTRELISTQKTPYRMQQQRPESPTVTLTWHASKYKVHKLHQGYILFICACRSRTTPGWKFAQPSTRWSRRWMK